jgi:hypothetical protein
VLFVEEIIIFPSASAVTEVAPEPEILWLEVTAPPSI